MKQTEKEKRELWARDMQICPSGGLNTSILWVGTYTEGQRAAKGPHGHPGGETLSVTNPKAAETQALPTGTKDANVPTSFI